MDQELTKKIMNDQIIKSFLQDNNLSENDVTHNFNEFLTVYFSNRTCEKCKSLDACNQSIQGMQKCLAYDEGYLSVHFTPCSYMKAQSKVADIPLFSNGYNFNQVYDAQVYNDKARLQVSKEIKRFLDEYEKGPSKGICVYGNHGSGKTFLMAKLAIELASNNHKVMFLYYPDLIRQLKSMIVSGNIEKEIKNLKTVEILFLDDFGAESTTPYIRDDVLGPIIQSRMEHHLPTFMTTNLDDIITHLSETKEEENKLKATRIDSRLRSMMNFVELKGENYRN